MARTENTVFISYRRADVYTALAVYETLTNQGYDVFFDYKSISSGDFEQIIASNIKARAHFLIILTPNSLDRCSEPGDWLRREIETAIDEKRNIVPLFFKGFRFGTPSISEKLTGKLNNLSRYNGLNVHEDYFEEAMRRVASQFLNIPLDTVLHPVSTEVQKVVKEEQVAADEALKQREIEKESLKPKSTEREFPGRVADRTKGVPQLNRLLLSGVIVVVLGCPVAIWSVWTIFSNSFVNGPAATQSAQATQQAATIQVGLTRTRLAESFVDPTTSMPPLFTMAATTEAPQTTQPTIETTLPTVEDSPPSGNIVFTCYIDQIDQICIMNADGTERKQLTNFSATTFYASLSHDGQTIYFSSRQSGRFEIYSMDIDGQNLQLLTDKIGSLYAPELSPNGKQIVFTNDKQGIWLMKSDGQNPHPITEDNDVDPTWSPNGSMIAFASARSGARQLYVMAADGSNIQQVTNLDDMGGRMAWSPDGTKLVFYRGPSGDRDIYLIRVDGTGLVQLTDGGDNLAPSWSPDGNWIAFASYRHGNLEVYIMHPDGSDVRRLTNNSISDWQPRWGQ